MEWDSSFGVRSSEKNFLQTVEWKNGKRTDGALTGVHRTRLHGEMTRNVVAPLPAKAGQAMSLPRKAERKETEKHEESLEKL